jgi:hypothetical protein
MKESVKKIENQSTVALIISAAAFVLAFVVQCLYLFTDIIAAPDLGDWAMYVAICLPAVAALLYIVAVPYSKRQYKQIVAMESLKAKVEAYISFQVRLKTIVIALSVVLAIVGVLVKMELMMLTCMALLVEMLVFRCMMSNPYTVKQRLQLTSDEMNELYGEGWEERIK